MAFELGRNVYLPSVVDGVYLLPYTWLDYGLKHGYITVMNKKFYDTLQGSIFLWLKEFREKYPKYTTDWYVYKSSGYVHPAKPDPSLFNGQGVPEIQGNDFVKLNIQLFDWTNIYKVGDPSDAKNLSNQYIQLFKGCGLRLERSVWDVPDDFYSANDMGRVKMDRLFIPFTEGISKPTHFRLS